MIRVFGRGVIAKLKKENSELVSATTQLKLLASDGKRYLTDMLDYAGQTPAFFLHDSATFAKFAHIF